MNLLNLIEDITTGYDNLRALMQAGQSGQDAVLNVGGETVTLDPMETRWMFGKYKAFNKAGRQEEFLNHLADPVKFDQHMKQLRQLLDKQKNFRGSVPGERGVVGDVPQGINELSSDLLQKSAQVAKEELESYFKIKDEELDEYIQRRRDTNYSEFPAGAHVTHVMMGDHVGKVVDAKNIPIEDRRDSGVPVQFGNRIYWMSPSGLVKVKGMAYSLNELSPDLLQRSAQVAKNKRDQAMDPKIHDALGGGYMNPLAQYYDIMSQKFRNRAVKVGQRDAVKKIASPAVMRKIGMSEGTEYISIGQQMANDGITYSPEKEDELIGLMAEYMKKDGMNSKAIRYYLNYDEDFISDQLSYLPKPDVAEGFTNDVDTVKHRIAVAKEMLDNPKTSFEMRQIASSILAQYRRQLSQYKDTEARYKGVAEGLAQDEAEKDSGWRAEFVNEINYNTFEVKVTNARSKESANFIIRPVDMISMGPTLDIETMDVRDLQTGQTESWTKDDPAPDGPIANAIGSLFYDDKQLQKKLWNIVDTHDTKGQDMMPGLKKRRSIGQEVDADAYIDSGEKTQAAMAKMKKGMAEGESTVEEIAMKDPNIMSAQTRGKLNWENMIQDYKNNKPYTEFEFGSDRPLTLYRSQVYAILKAFGNMKPQNKVNTILNTFGDKMATVEYLDKLRAKGMMPKKVPAYVAPGTEPTPPGQMSFPGMDAPKIREADDQKKNPKTTDLDGAVNPRVARAMQLARARQSAAGTDTEAMVADFVDQQEKDQAEFNKVKSVNQRQDDLLKQVTAVNQQQDREINSLDSDNADLQANLQQLQAVNADLAKKLADVSQRRADRQPEPQAPAQTPAQSTATSAQTTAEPPLQTATSATPATTTQPAPVKQKKTTTRKKSSATKIQRPQRDLPDNVYQFPQNGKRGLASDEVSAALQGVDMDDELFTGTYGLRENTETLNMGDPVIISGNVEFNGKTGDVVGFGRDQHFVIVNLYNFGKHAFHASNVKYNDYADQEVEEGRMKDLDISGQNIPALRIGNFVVVQKKQDQVIPLRQHTDSLSAQRHAQAIKNKYPGMQIGIQNPEGTVKYVSIKEMQTKLDRYNVNQPPPGGTNKQREEFLNARDRLFRQMQSASPGEKEAIRLKIAELEGKAQSQGVKIRETDDLNRSGYNAIKSLSDWAEKMRVVRELQKDIVLMSDPESKAAVQQRIGDLLKIGIKQGYVKEALSDKAMSVLRGLQQPAQSTPAAIDLNVPEPDSEPAMELAAVRKRIAQLDELIRMKEQIDRLFVRAQNARGGIYPGLQSDIEDEELYGVPQTDQEYQTLKHKYTKDLTALQKFIAMKKAVYREGQEIVGESSALVRLKRARQAMSQPSQVNELAPASNPGGGNYFQTLASAWYNGAFDTGSLQKGIKSQEDVERLLQRGIVGPDGVTRKYGIDYNAEFDGVVISSDDYYEHSDYNDQGQEVDSRTGQKWGPYDYMEFSDDDLREGINEFAPGAGGSDDGGEDPYKYPKPESYRRSIDFFGKFEADHFDREDFDEATGVFKGYWGTTQIAYFKFNDPARTDSDDPGMGWYYEPQNESVAEGWKNVVAGSAMALGALGAQAQTADLSGYNTQYLQQVAAGEHPRPMVSVADAKAELQARANGKQTVAPATKPQSSSGYSKEYLQKAADPNRFGRYMISVEKAQELLNKMNEGVAEGQTDYQKRRQRERDVDAGKPVARQPKNPQSDYARMRAKQKRDQDLGEQQMCPECGGPSFSDLILAEKQDACYHKVRSRYKVWPSAYASGALVQCRKKGAANWGNKKK
jgi:hypothetical protein